MLRADLPRRSVRSRMSGIFDRPGLLLVADRLFLRYREMPRAIVIRCVEAACDEVADVDDDEAFAARVEGIAQARLDAVRAQAAGPRRRPATSV